MFFRYQRHSLVALASPGLRRRSHREPRDSTDQKNVLHGPFHGSLPVASELRGSCNSDMDVNLRFDVQNTNTKMTWTHDLPALGGFPRVTSHRSPPTLSRAQPPP